MKVFAWRAALLIIGVAAWETIAAPLNPILYIRPSSLPGAVVRMCGALPSCRRSLRTSR